MKKIPAEVKKELMGRAKELPLVQYKNFDVRSQVSGETLIGIGVNKIKDESQVNPKESYITGAEPKQLDHYQKLRKLWLASKTEPEAWQKIAAYCAQVKHKFNKE